MNTAAPSSAPAIELRDVSRIYGSHPAISEVSLSMKEARITGLLGPNGAGKTTLLRMIAGLIDPSSGTVLIHGRRQSIRNRALRHEVGLVSLDCPFYDELTVREVLTLQAILMGLPADVRVARLADAGGNEAIAGMLDRRMDELSTGMTQRVRIARAMLHQPRVLLLDEPTSGLDPEVRRSIWQDLRALAKRGVCILMTTHNLQEAADLCTTIHVLHRGRLVRSHEPNSEGMSTAKLESTYFSIVEPA